MRHGNPWNVEKVGNEKRKYNAVPMKRMGYRDIKKVQAYKLTAPKGVCEIRSAFFLAQRPTQVRKQWPS